MDAKYFHTKVKEGLQPFGKLSKFTYKPKHELRRKLPYCEQFILMGTSSYPTNNILACPHAHIRFGELEKMLAPFYSVFCGVTDFNNPYTYSIRKMFEYKNIPKYLNSGSGGLSLKVKNENTTVEAVQLLISTIEQEVYPFFEQIQTYEEFDEYMEKFGYADNDPIAMIRWLLVKKIIKAPHYDKVKENRISWFNTTIDKSDNGDKIYYETYMRYFDFLETV